MDRNLAEKKTYNKGFSLFTVIVAIAFVGILGMLVIYIAKIVFIQLNRQLRK